MDGTSGARTPGRIDPEEFLSHFGVKGMKWGVRKNNEKHGDFVVGKENPIYNISSNAPRDINGHVYAAFTKNDVINYRSMYVHQLASFVGASKVFSNSFELKGDLKVAGKNAQVEAFKKLWEKDKEGIAKTLAESQVDVSFVAAIINRGLKIDRTKAYEKRFMEASESYMMNKGYKQFQSALTLPNNNFKSKYYSLLAKRGYSALLDMNDVRAFGGEKPVLIFKGKNHLKNRDTVELTDTDLKLAMETYFDPKKLEKYDIKQLHVKHHVTKGGEMTHTNVQDFLLEQFESKGSQMDNVNYEPADFLQHYGIKGMKWGSRLKRSPKEGPSSDSERITTIRKRAKRSKVKALSNAELQAAINRMNLEQNYKKLSNNERPIVTRFVATTLAEIGQREAKNLISEKATGLLRKKSSS